MLRPIKRKGPFPLKPTKLAKQVAIEKTSERVVQAESEQQDSQVNNKQMHTNATVLGKQRKIVNQLNAKQIDNLISDRNTIVYLTVLLLRLCLDYLGNSSS